MMRIKELIEITGASRQTIHFYTREGLLPRPRKTSPNQAEYSQDHVERIQLIKELHEQFFLPLATIKKIVRKQKRAANGRSILKTKTEYFKPLDQFLPQDIQGEATFLEITGISHERLADFENWGILAPKLVDDQKVYSHHDLTIGRVIGEMRKLGISYEKGFRRDALRDFRDMFQAIMTKVGEEFAYGTRNKVSLEHLDELGEIYIEVMAVFFYHLCHRLAKKEVERNLDLLKLEQGKS